MTSPTFTKRELEAIIAYRRDKPNFAAYLHAATDCMMVLDGEEPESADPFGDLADLLETGCHSTLAHLHALEVARLAAGQRAFAKLGRAA